MSAEETPWHAAFPSPRTTNPASLPRSTVLQWLKEGTKVPGADFLLVDLRRTDFEGGTIRGSLNLPAQSLYPTLGTLYSLVRKAGVRDVIFYCGMLYYISSLYQFPPFSWCLGVGWVLKLMTLV
jgi:arsenical-resistance protein 2